MDFQRGLEEAFIQSWTLFTHWLVSRLDPQPFRRLYEYHYYYYYYSTTIVGVNLGQPRTPRYHKLSTNSPPPFQIYLFHDAHSSIHDAGFTSRSLLHNIASALASQPTLSTLSFNTCHSSSCLQPSRQLTNLCLFVRYFPWRMKETQIRFLQLAVYISEFVLCIPYDDAM